VNGSRPAGCAPPRCSHDGPWVITAVGECGLLSDARGHLAERHQRTSPARTRGAEPRHAAPRPAHRIARSTWLLALAPGSGPSSPWLSSPSPSAGPAPSSSARTSTTDWALPSSAVQLRCWSRPTTTTRLPLASDSAACLAWLRRRLTLSPWGPISRTTDPHQWRTGAHQRRAGPASWFPDRE
jgi:hypothetical protein